MNKLSANNNSPHFCLTFSVDKVLDLRVERNYNFNPCVSLINVDIWISNCRIQLWDWCFWWRRQT